MPRNQEYNKKRISPSVVAIVGAILTLTGGFFISYNYIQSKKVIAYDYMANAFYEKNQTNKDIASQITESTEGETEKVEESDTYTDEYIGYLTIPKINLHKGFVDRRSTENDVEKNIMIVEGSNYPDVKRGNFIIAGHSGTGWKAFFNDLYQLTTGDTAEVTYKGKRYIYKITNIYKQQKTGKIAIYRNYDKTTLTLVTCTNNDDTTQTIYIAELQKVEEE
ncbi:MAG TPA: sortase [Candidatus Faecimonas gallistercoris]|nr:sortase [Candidatus Faecimonas gallistercoris]